jgi:biopolymer transport protein TolR
VSKIKTIECRPPGKTADQTYGRVCAGQDQSMPQKLPAPPVMAAPNVIPMTDIMLVLLIIFMVITPLLGPGVPVKMASAENAARMPNADQDDAIILGITRDGSLFLSPGAKRIDLQAVGDRVKEIIADRADKTIYIRSDARAKYGDVVKAVDQVRMAGAENVGLLTEKTQNKESRPWE